MFSGETILKRVSSTEYELLSTLTWQTREYSVTIKPYMITDGASIPRALWSIIGSPLTGKYVGSALIHDGLYASEVVDRVTADKIFRDMLKDNGVSWIQRQAMYYAVHLFGGSVWAKHKPEEVEANKKLVEFKGVYNG